MGLTELTEDARQISVIMFNLLEQNDLQIYVTL